MTPPPAAFETASPILRGAEIVDGVLPADFSSLNLRLETATGDHLPIAGVDAVELNAQSVTEMFRTRSDGSLALADVPAFTALLGAEPPLALRVRAGAHDATLRFAIGRHRPTFRLVAPPGLGAAASEASMRLVHLPTELSFWQASDGRGRVSFPSLPEGGYRIEVESLRGQRIFAQQGFFLDQDKSVDVTLYAKTAGAARIERDGTVVPIDAAQRYTRIAALLVYAVDDTFKVRSLSIIDWPSDRMKAEAREQELRDTEQQLLSATAGTWQRVTVRAFDAEGEVTHRQVIATEVLTGQAENFIIHVPLKTTYRLEVQGWHPVRRVHWTLDELRKDPSIEQAKALFEPE